MPRDPLPDCPVASLFPQQTPTADEGAASSDSLLAWLTLTMTPGIGPGTCRRLVEAFGSPAGVIAARPAVLAAVPGVKRSLRDTLAKGWDAGAAQRELDACARQGIRPIAWDSPLYPEALRHIDNPPMVLFVKGEAALLAAPAVAVVGARAASSYGARMAARFARELAAAGLVVTSGLALGVDTAAHEGTLAGGGKTVAVLGSGLDVVYPRENRRLFAAVAASGAVVTEYPLGTQPDSFRFPARNRIISGVSLGVLVIEAASQSGSLITARLALEQGREVFAVPGRIDSAKSTGTHRLLQQGAKLVSGVEDILEELRLPFRRPAAAPGGQHAAPGEAPAWTPGEQTLLDLLDAYGLEIDEIIRRSGLPTGEVSQLLLHLELQGAVEAMPGGRFRRKEL